MLYHLSKSFSKEGEDKFKPPSTSIDEVDKARLDEFLRLASGAGHSK